MRSFEYIYNELSKYLKIFQQITEPRLFHLLCWQLSNMSFFLKQPRRKQQSRFFSRRRPNLWNLLISKVSQTCFYTFFVTVTTSQENSSLRNLGQRVLLAFRTLQTLFLMTCLGWSEGSSVLGYAVLESTRATWPSPTTDRISHILMKLIFFLPLL